jgi:hypothetical protein
MFVGGGCLGLKNADRKKKIFSSEIGIRPSNIGFFGIP